MVKKMNVLKRTLAFVLAAAMIVTAAPVSTFAKPGEKPVTYCGLEEHREHGPACYKYGPGPENDKNKEHENELKCNKEIHMHTDACYVAPSQETPETVAPETQAPEAESQPEATDAQTEVYVYVNPDSIKDIPDSVKSELGISKLKTNASGWYTIGKLTTTAVHAATPNNKVVSTDEYNAVFEQMLAGTGFERLNSNNIIDITKADKANSKLKYQEDADDYLVGNNVPTWHLDLYMPNYYTVTFKNNDGTTTNKYAFTNSEISEIPEIANGRDNYSDADFIYTYEKVWMNGDTIVPVDKIKSLREDTTLTADVKETKTPKSEIKAKLSVKSVTYGEAVVANIVWKTAAPDYTGTPVYEYKLKDNGTYSTTVPTEVGDYKARVTFPATDLYKSKEEYCYFSILPKEVTTINLPNKYYTGSEVTLGNGDVKIGDKTLVLGSDYTIDAESYKNNVKVSTADSKAEVTLEFQGNYSGTVTANYNIVKNTMVFINTTNVKATKNISDFVYVGQLAIEDQFYQDAKAVKDHDAFYNANVKKYLYGNDWDSMATDAVTYKNNKSATKVSDLKTLLFKNAADDYKLTWYYNDTEKYPADKFYNNEGYHIDGIFVEKAERTASVTMKDWMYGNTASTPALNCDTLDNATPVYYYKSADAEDSTYTTDKPSAIGNYVVKVVIPTTEDYKKAEATATFAITAKPVTVHRLNPDQTWTKVGTGAFNSEASYDALPAKNNVSVEGQEAMLALFAEASVTYTSDAKLEANESILNIYDVIAIKKFDDSVHVDLQLKEEYIERLNKNVEYYLKRAGYARPKASTGDNSNYYVLYGTGTTVPTAKSGMTEVGMDKEAAKDYIESQLIVKPAKTTDEFVKLLKKAGYSYTAEDVERLGLTVDWYRFINTSPMHVDGDVLDASGIPVDTYYPVYVYQRVEGQEDAYVGVIKAGIVNNENGQSSKIGKVTADQITEATPVVDGYRVVSILDEEGNAFNADYEVKGTMNVYVTLEAIPAAVPPVTPAPTPYVPVVVEPATPAPTLPQIPTTPAAVPAAGAQVPVAQPAAPAVQAEEPQVQELVEQPSPLAAGKGAEEATLEDDEAPLAAQEDNCIIHIIILALTVLVGIYNIVRAFARKKENEDAADTIEE